MKVESSRMKGEVVIPNKEREFFLQRIITQQFHVVKKLESNFQPLLKTHLSA